MSRLDSIDAQTLRRRRSAKWSVASGDMIAASVADMDFPVAPAIAEVLSQMIDADDLGYPPGQTPAGLPTVFAHRMHERFAWDVDPERVEVMTDVVQGLYLAIGAFSREGDALVTPSPVYPPFLDALRATRRVPVWKRYEPAAGGYRIDFDRLRAELTPRTRMLLVCNPHNPTGRVLAERELEELAGIALARDLVIVSDEIHADLVYTGARHVPFAKILPEISARTITLTSATKAFNIAGLRCAVAVFGSEEMQRRFSHVDRHIRGGLGSFGLAATEAAWTRCQDWQDEVLRYLEGNRDFVADFVRRQWPQVVHAAPEATYLSWLDFRAYALEPTPCAFFREHAHVLLAAGEDFGEAGCGFARVNFATSRAILAEVLERMDRALARHARRGAHSPAAS